MAPTQALASTATHHHLARPTKMLRALLLIALAAAPTRAAGLAAPALHDAALYEVYSELHALSQQTDALSLQQLHAPTVVICGRQTDGKSALLEALMGFQFNHVGGGTKTRRP